MPKAILFDIGGVLCDGDTALPGAVQAVARARAAGLAVRFVTNTSRSPAAGIGAMLTHAGFAVQPGELYTATRAARDYLQARGLRPWCLVHPDIAAEFAPLQTGEPNAVLVADAGDGFSYAALNEAFRLCLQGLPLVATGETRYFRAGSALWLDAGPFVKALEYASGMPAVITGKPSAVFFRQVLASIPCEPGEAVMIGDDVQADVLGALDAGLQACLVHTGKFRTGDEQTLGQGGRQAATVGAAVDAILGA